MRTYNRTRRASIVGGAEQQGDGAKSSRTEMVMPLDFGHCRLQVQAPANGPYATGKDLVGKTIATSFVDLAAEHFAKLELGLDAETKGSDVVMPKKLRTKIIELGGSVEAACALGVADGIVDLVGTCSTRPLNFHPSPLDPLLTQPSSPESGETMKAAGLKALDTVLETESILIKSSKPSNPALVDLIASRIAGVITAKRYVLCQYNILRSSLAEATKISPGKRAPTITSLDEEGWCAVSIMVEKKRIAIVMDELTKVGAQDILVLDIKNSR